ncbi:MAG: DUF3422 domain-containing protein [Methylomonas sp.]|nr:DUF3422 domain-containing protein [Methylomonas sp.]PPD22920.1 MAG: hypothetical protein CTY23_00975 [Methylomonas sp.]PPD26472.1 MAG: hypothetical protein CTY22_05145 [Methylomonas sp.]PPD38240.1 MAG: hypothetical protein CTY21_05140 [Methylomonas sp.]PPD41957.1 MAG: hypothetical protein CTY17_02520 [Methylomonas sp.]
MTTLFQIPHNHPQRFILHNEVHARASPILRLPVSASYLALSLSGEEKARERQHITALCQRFGCLPPGADADHFSASFDAFQMSWEQHGEFSAYTFYTYDTAGAPFSSPALTRVPIDWLARIGGQTVVAAHACIVAAEDIGYHDETDLSPVSVFFAGNPVVGSNVTGGAASAFTDFKIHVDGFSRFLVVNHSLKTAQAGRLLHRLFDIEVYRVLALLAFPIARTLYPELKKADRQLYALTSSMTQADANDAKLLDELTALAALVENHISSNQFRFAAASAYHQLVGQRLVDLRETRIQGIQTLGEFLKRRLEPAMTTCHSISHRFNLVSERISNASQLLRTKVDILIERQNQALLASMALRAKMQLRMQQMVEGISMVAITYYAASLVGAVAEAVHAFGWHVEPAIAEGVAIPFILIVIVLGRKRMHAIIASTTDAA